MVIIHELDFRMFMGIEFEYPLSQTLFDHEMETELDIFVDCEPHVKDIQCSIHASMPTSFARDVKDQLEIERESIDESVDDIFEHSHLKNNYHHNNDLRMMRFEIA